MKYDIYLYWLQNCPRFGAQGKKEEYIRGSKTGHIMAKDEGQVRASSLFYSL